MKITHVQTILFDKYYWTEQKARNWLLDHNFKYSKIDIKPNYYRFRQKSPSSFI